MTGKTTRARQWKWTRVVCLAALATAFGCGLLADKDRIRIAKIKDRYITRGDLATVIRDLPNEERPRIRTKNDVLHALNTYLDEEIRNLTLEGLPKDVVDQMELLRPQAARQYDAANPEYANLDSRDNKSMEDYNITAGDIKALKEIRQLGIDRVFKKLKGQAAVGYRIQQGLKDKTLSITDEEYAKKYELRHHDLVVFESITFAGVCFPTAVPNASALAAEARDRLRSGKKLEDIVAEYAAANQAFSLQTAIENDPSKEKFVGFWEQASGAGKGNIVGPVFIRGWQATRKDDAGRTSAAELPDAYLVCQVIEQTPQREKTLEEAKPDLVYDICYVKMIEQLRKENGVEIHENKLPNPSMYEDKRAGKGNFGQG